MAELNGKRAKRPPACIQCRKRKIGCDRVKPICGNCRKGNKPNCSFPSDSGLSPQSPAAPLAVPETHQHQRAAPPPRPQPQLQRQRQPQPQPQPQTQPQPQPQRLPILQPQQQQHPKQKLPKQQRISLQQQQQQQHVQLSQRQQQQLRSKHRFTPPIKQDRFVIHKSSARESSHTPPIKEKHLAKNVPRSSDLSALQQIKEYNTKMELLRVSNQRIFSAPPKNTPKTQSYIPRSAAPRLEKNPVQSLANTNVELNWVQGPAIFDPADTPYTPRDAVLTELPLLQARLFELQAITGKQLDSTYLSLEDPSVARPTGEDYDDEEDDDYDSNNTDNRSQRLSTLDHQQQLGSGGKPTSPPANSIDEFRDLDPTFLDPNEVFSIFQKNASVIDENPILDSPSSIFTLKFLRNRDDFLFKFMEIFRGIYGEHDWEVRDIPDPVANNINDKSLIRFPFPLQCLAVIKKYIDIVKESGSLIPILDPVDLLKALERELVNNQTFVPKDLTLSQLVTFGLLSLCLLLTFETLSSTVLIVLKDAQLDMFKQLQQFLPFLLINVQVIKLEVQKRAPSTESVDYLKFLALMKYYYSLTSFASNRISLDFDEDMHLARHQSLNCEQKNEQQIQLWNFICKNYLRRHLFRGQYPVFTSPECGFGSTPIADLLFRKELDMLNSHTDLIKYLQSKDHIISLKRVILSRDSLKTKYADLSRKCLTPASLINGVVDSLIYRNTSLYVSYFLLLQYEELNDVENFVECYKEFLPLIQDTIFFVFSNLANKNFAGYEFLFINQLFTLMSTFSDMIFGLYCRGNFAYTNNTASEASDAERTETQQHSDLWILILRKLFMLLFDYSKNCKIVNPLLLKTTNKIVIILSFDSILNDETKTEKAANIKSMFSGTNNIFERIPMNRITQFNVKIKSISESLINSDFYNRREPFKPTETETLSVTKDNFQRCYESFL
ncbi:Rsc3p KNAG_0M01560 [Huiozyma naganishii CBS 8797]|uniref:Zn(2)-C6 fungal-type domain-containing protein n=1 Tax=Huiozyma naganishii (strain ATCC MYA-139 / BCRC 22969 / CBS 8797 / KCTC 17520 / NBRC 10181 / NCYC 3082 / Yp74L-3) TaxID=1071383 RepID=J7SAT3_HUIN7|nr:hypothetical protein KNAG_0M01560 [Kazachstania naganishii CBS 8797]CCK73009.1 hypothetical protein KNAG_0M01560 [Kazachstania naganishii CBS 8797]